MKDLITQCCKKLKGILTGAVFVIACGLTNVSGSGSSAWAQSQSLECPVTYDVTFSLQGEADQTTSDRRMQRRGGGFEGRVSSNGLRLQLRCDVSTSAFLRTERSVDVCPSKTMTVSGRSGRFSFSKFLEVSGRASDTGSSPECVYGIAGEQFSALGSNGLFNVVEGNVFSRVVSELPQTRLDELAAQEVQDALDLQAALGNELDNPQSQPEPQPQSQPDSQPQSEPQPQGVDDQQAQNEGNDFNQCLNRFNGTSFPSNDARNNASNCMNTCQNSGNRTVECCTSCIEDGLSDIADAGDTGQNGGDEVVAQGGQDTGEPQNDDRFKQCMTTLESRDFGNEPGNARRDSCSNFCNITDGEQTFSCCESCVTQAETDTKIENDRLAKEEKDRQDAEKTQVAQDDEAEEELNQCIADLRAVDFGNEPGNARRDSCSNFCVTSDDPKHHSVNCCNDCTVQAEADADEEIERLASIERDVEKEPVQEENPVIEEQKEEVVNNDEDEENNIVADASFSQCLTRMDSTDFGSSTANNTARNCLNTCDRNSDDGGVSCCNSCISDNLEGEEEIAAAEEKSSIAVGEKTPDGSEDKKEDIKPATLESQLEVFTATLTESGVNPLFVENVTTRLTDLVTKKGLSLEDAQKRILEEEIDAASDLEGEDFIASLEKIGLPRETAEAIEAGRTRLIQAGVSAEDANKAVVTELAAELNLIPASTILDDDGNTPTEAVTLLVAVERIERLTKTGVSQDFAEKLEQKRLALIKGGELELEDVDIQINNDLQKELRILVAVQEHNLSRERAEELQTERARLIESGVDAKILDSAITAAIADGSFDVDEIVEAIAAEGRIQSSIDDDDLNLVEALEKEKRRAALIADGVDPSDVDEKLAKGDDDAKEEDKAEEVVKTEEEEKETAKEEEKTEDTSDVVQTALETKAGEENNPEAFAACIRDDIGMYNYSRDVNDGAQLCIQSCVTDNRLTVSCCSFCAGQASEVANDDGSGSTGGATGGEGGDDPTPAPVVESRSCPANSPASTQSVAIAKAAPDWCCWRPDSAACRADGGKKDSPYSYGGHYKKNYGYHKNMRNYHKGFKHNPMFGG